MCLLFDYLGRRNFLFLRNEWPTTTKKYRIFDEKIKSNKFDLMSLIPRVCRNIVDFF